MLKTKLQKGILIAVLFATLILSVVCLLLPDGKNQTQAATVVLNGSEISETYEFGATFTAPSAKINFNGEEYDATLSSVVYPDGKGYKDNSYLLSMAGQYTVIYSANVDGNDVVASVTFMVSGKAFEVSGENSSAYYGSIDRTDASGNVLYEEGTENKLTTEGIIVSLSAGDSFTYKKPIDLKDKTKYDQILELYALPEILGKADARILKVKLIDAYDQNNFVEVVTYGNYGDEDELDGWALYSGARANNQPITGLHFYANAGSRTFTYQGQLYTLNKNIVYNSANGYPSYEFSLAAARGYGDAEYSLSMDYAEKQIFGCKQKDCDRPISSSSNGMIIDLDEPMFFDELWQGFTTGEVYVNISAENYVSSSFNFIITDILDEDLENTEFVDQVSPWIDINFPEGDNVPSAIVGEEYKIFEAQAFDAINGKIAPRVVVYRNYHSSNPVMMKVDSGAFVPDKEGLYTILYKAVDRSGNVCEEKIDVYSKSESDLDIVLTDVVSENLAGKRANIKVPTIVGADGKHQLSIVAVCGETEYEIDLEDFSFLPLNAGEYTIKYSCSDYNVSIEKEYLLTVASNAVPTFIDDAYLPPVFVKGVKYQVPTLKGYDFSSGSPVENSATISYAFDNGEFLTYQDSGFVVDANEKVKVKYSLGNNVDSNKVYEVPVADVGITVSEDVVDKYIRSRYFYGEEFSVEAIDNVVYSTFAEDANLTFVNKLLTSNFTLGFEILNVGFEKLTISLTDISVKENALSLTLRPKDSTTSYISINGGQEQILSKSLTGEKMEISYSEAENTLTVANVSYKLDGFTGFASKLAYLNLNVSGDGGYTAIDISEVNSQQITSADTDNAPPTYIISVNNDEKAVGEELIISEFIAVDVLKFVTTAKLSVRGPDGYCVAEDGTIMNNVTDFTKTYVIKLNKIGTYYINGTVSDGVRSDNVTKQVIVKDTEGPKITLGEAKTKVKVGKSFDVAEYTVTDNIDKNVMVIVSIVCPSLKVVNVLDGEFETDVAGVYTVMYYATDSEGNVAFVSYDVTVYAEDK